MPTYYVSIAIDVDAESHTEAAQRAWSLLSGADALQPICEVLGPDEIHPTNIDPHLLTEQP